MITRLTSLLIFLLALTTSLSVRADSITVAVASNFTAPANDLATAFEKETGHSVRLTFGSSGKLLAQVTHGAPFDVFLSADQAKPLKLEEESLAVPGTRFTYALGTLALWTASDTPARDILMEGEYSRLALANPRLAPYGEAAMQVLSALGLSEASQPKIVMGENITQTWQFVATGNAEIGFVALSQILKDGEISPGNAWVIPADLYDPVKQDAVLLTRAKDNDVARQWLAFLQSEAGQNVIKGFGYSLPESH